MTEQHPPRRAFSVLRIRAIAATRIRRVVRTRIALAAAVLALLPWSIVDSPLLVGRLSTLAEFSVVGLTVLAAGSIGDDLDSGEFAIAVSHDVSPLEILIGNAAASLLLASLLVAAQLPLVLLGVAAPDPRTVVPCVLALVPLFAGWLALMLLLGTFLDGKGNAIAMVAVLFVPFALQLGLLARLPSRMASIAEQVIRVVPQVNQVTALFRALVERAPVPVLDLAVLIASPFIYFAFATYRLHRLEPAGRLTQ
jgi:hypothetical protein